MVNGQGLGCPFGLEVKVGCKDLKTNNITLQQNRRLYLNPKTNHFYFLTLKLISFLQWINHYVSFRYLC
jgi:hypothetical protein